MFARLTLAFSDGKRKETENPKERICRSELTVFASQTIFCDLDDRCLLWFQRSRAAESCWPELRPLGCWQKKNRCGEIWKRKKKDILHCVFSKFWTQWNHQLLFLSLKMYETVAILCAVMSLYVTYAFDLVWFSEKAVWIGNPTRKGGEKS